MWATKEAAIADLAREDVEAHGGGQPDLIVVDEAFLAGLAALRGRS